MRFGQFDDARREYVIDTPRTPLPWINYLGSEDFFSLVDVYKRQSARSLCAAERLHGKEPGSAPAPEHFKYTVPAPAGFPPG